METREENLQEISEYIQSHFELWLLKARAGKAAAGPGNAVLKQI